MVASIVAQLVGVKIIPDTVGAGQDEEFKLGNLFQKITSTTDLSDSFDLN